MKQIYKIGTVQYFTYTIPPVFRFSKKPPEITKHWVIRNAKYIYANNEEEAKEKYKNWFFKEYTEITHGWGNWYSESNGTYITMEEDWIDITSTEIIIIDDKNINVNYEKLKENMQADNFKEWWFDNGRCNQLPE